MRLVTGRDQLIPNGQMTMEEINRNEQLNTLDIDAPGTSVKKERVWELDVFRGIAIIGVIIVHFIFDLTYFLNVNVKTPAIFDFIQENGGVLFIILSGICVTLGHSFLKRGIIVFMCGAAVTWVTYVMYLLKISGKDIIIYWGILHLLGFCMILYGLLKKIPTAVLPFIALALIITGYIVTKKTYDLNGFAKILTIFGFPPYGFMTGDYFPVMPNLGWFIAGIFIGRTLYKKQKTLFPRVNTRFILIRVFSFIGRHSLIIYLLHQPLISAIVGIIGEIVN
jgi:uncharacterized membrane protein